MDDVTPNFSLLEAAFAFLVAQRTVRGPGKSVTLRAAAEEKDRQVGGNGEMVKQNTQPEL